MKRFIKYFIVILAAALFSTAIHAQGVTNSSTVIARENLRFGGQSPDTNKIAVSMDALGNVKWVYFSDFQDSVNTGVYDTLNTNILSTNNVKVNRDSFTDPAASIASIGDSGFVVQCAASCDDIRWTTIDGTQTVLKDITDNVGIGTNSPTATLDVQNLVGGAALYLNSEDLGGNYANYSFGGGSVNYNYADVLSGTGAMLMNDKFNFNGTGSVYFQENNTFGNVGVGTSTPTEKLHVAGTSLFTDTLTYDIPSAATGYVMTALDADGNATWQDPNAYGEMGFGDSSRLIALTQNVFSVVTNSNNTLWSSHATVLHNVTYAGDSLVIDSGGVFKVDLILSLFGTANTVVKLGIFVNGALVLPTQQLELQNALIAQMDYMRLVVLNAGDVLKVVATNATDNDDITVVSGTILINRID